MPASVANTRLPRAATASTDLVRTSVEFRIARAGVVRGVVDVDFTRECGVEVVDVDAAVLAAGIDVAGIGAGGRREMAADERLQHVVAAEGDERAVVRVGAVVFVLERHEAVVEAGREAVGVDAVEFLGWHHFAQVPELHHLVFAVAEHVAAVAFAVDVCEAFGVAHEDACFAAVAHASSVPDFDGRVVGAGVEDVWRCCVAETDGIDVVFVGGDSEDGFAGFNVIDVYRSI